ncbi:serine carboxypeptidase S28-domain-containing protein [Hysterangium stoloniferum]|nr:serine carboxypeptidase S28-domain-containing protein [Hysterangium stoloniferum]
MAGARHPNSPPRPAIPLVTAPDTPVADKKGTTLPPLSTVYQFDQLIDHDNPSRGTFKQRGPVILMTPGETNAEGFTGYLTNTTINGLIAQANNATIVLIEHRFFGLSNPLPDLKDESLALLTIDQAAKDLAFFAKTAVLPQPGGDEINADRVPWIMTGGSYAGALTAWTMVDQPGIFWAGYASSAVVEAITDYWGYFEPIRQNMPANCSADVQAVVSHFDEVFTFGTPEEQQSLKEMFGMGDMTHLDDVAGSLRNILWDWQSLQPYIGPGATFFHSCDALEVKDGINAPPSGWGLTHALEAWGAYFTNTYLPAICGSDSREDCLGTYNASQSFFTDTSLDNAERSWMWSECNEVGYLQDGAPIIWPSLVTRLVQPSYDERQCSYMFPTAFPQPTAPRVAETNAKFLGWDIDVERLFFANGKQDPWREATVSSDFHTRLSTPSQPIFVGNGFHCSDLIVKSSVDPTIEAVIDAGVTTISNWIAEWPGSESSKTLQAVSSPAPFTPLDIPSSVVSATPEAVPPVATQATGSPPETAGSTGRFAVPNAMIRQAVEL